MFFSLKTIMFACENLFILLITYSFITLAMKKYINPFTDWAFKRIFGLSILKSATTRLYDTEAKIICIVSKKGAQCIECHHKDI